jgi:hypothetical protein
MARVGLDEREIITCAGRCARAGRPVSGSGHNSVGSYYA